MDWLLSGLTILMNFLLSRKNKWAWVLMVGLSILWVVYALSIKQPGLIPASVVNFFIAIGGGIKWFRDERQAV